jgi:GR25 family glycosyltransferase involved in LPS biosynthesis
MDHRINDDKIDKAACCSVSHALIWKRIAETQQCAIVLEHDALMLHPINMNIPDGKIVVLGYKLNDPSKYDHIAAGPPRKIIDIDHHNGAHAYALTPKTAQSLLDELRTGGGGGPIDNRFFMKKRRSRVPLAVVDPTPAIGWIRQSTIWNKADTFYGSTISSFHKHLKS